LSDATGAAPRQLARFTRAERWVHRSLAIVLGVLMVTGALLFFPDLGSLVGNRALVSQVHEITGWLVPIPLLLALASRAFRADAGRLNRFAPTDWEWLRSRDRRSGRIPVGKFNAGQKLNASFVLGSTLVLLGTGLMLRYFSLVPEELRPGATLVHDLTALAFAVVTAGHLAKAWADPGARAGMRTGEVGAGWARHHHRGWAEEMAAGG